MLTFGGRGVQHNMNDMILFGPHSAAIVLAFIHHGGAGTELSEFQSVRALQAMLHVMQLHPAQGALGDSSLSFRVPSSGAWKLRGLLQ